MRQLTLLLAAIFSILQVCAQSPNSAQIKGRIYDKETLEWLPLATIVCSDPLDSSKKTIRLTNNDGRFLIDSLPIKDYVLQVSFIGYNPIKLPVLHTNSSEIINLGNIGIQRKNLFLSQVEIKSTRSPISLRKDTIELTAEYFKPKQNDYIEDLFKKLPGIQIDNNGTIRFNGVIIKDIMVNGKPLFMGEDSKIISQNILANIIDKVQIIENKDVQKKQVGINNGISNKVINITTKKNIEDIINGQVTAAVGTSQTYGSKLNLNQFKEGQQLVAIASIDNINGLLDGVIASNNGIEKKWKSGLNYSKKLNNKLQFNSSYIIQQSKLITQQKSTRKTFLNDTSNLYNQKSNNNVKGSIHRINVQLEYQIDSLLKISTTNQFLTSTDNKSSGNEYESLDLDLNIINNGKVSQNKNDNGNSISSNITIEKKFKKTGRSLNVLAGYLRGGSNGFEKNKSDNYFYRTNGDLVSDSINTRGIYSGQNTNLFFYIDYNEPISKFGLITFSYGEDHINQPFDRKTYSFNSLTNNYDILNGSLSTSFKYSNLQRYAKSSWNNAIGKFDYTISIAEIFSAMNNIDKHLNEKKQIKSAGILPSVRLKLDLTTNNTLHLVYFRNMNFPGLNELLPLLDNSNPLYIRKGNSELKPSKTENIELAFNSLNPTSLRFISIIFNGSLTSNQIINSQWIDTLGRQIIQPINLSASSKIGLSLYGYFPLKNVTSNIKINTNSMYSKDLNHLNGTTGNYKTLSINQLLSYSYNYKTVFDLTLATNINYIRTQYSSAISDRNKNIRYTFILESNITLPANFTINSMISHEHSVGIAKSYNTNNTLINISISKSLLQRKQGLIKFQVFDLLNQNVKINQVTGENYVENYQTNQLRRTFLLKFSYIIGK